MLTVTRARHVYSQLIDPLNRTISAVNGDVTDQVTIAQFRHDLRAEIASVRATNIKLAAVHWPPRVEPYVRAMLSTDFVASIRCARDLQAAQTYSQVNAISANQDCTAAGNTSNADTIRSMLGLPPVGG